MGERRTVPDVWPVLAATRFALATVVLVSHMRIVMPSLDMPVYAAVTSFGPFAAVVAFFVISGYSIAHSVETRTEGFYARRFWRICPT